LTISFRKQEKKKNKKKVAGMEWEDVLSLLKTKEKSKRFR